MPSAPPPSDWEAWYQSHDTPWDLGGATPAFSRLIQEGRLTPGKLLVPGAGRGHDAIAFAKAGFPVTAIDLAPSACATMRQRAAAEGIPLEVVCGDFFSHEGSYDLALEYTFYCAIPPALREAYRDRMHRLLVPGGLLFGLFFPLNKPPETGGPPHGVQREEVEASLSKGFDLLHAEFPRDSIKPRRGNEILMIWRRR